MTHTMNPLRAALFALPLVAACGGWITVDGYDAAYVDVVPANIESYPHYTYDGGEVYVVDGRYYHRGGDGRWVRFRTRPREAAARVAPGRESPRVEPRRPEERNDVRR